MGQNRLIALDREAARTLFASRGSPELLAIVAAAEEQSEPQLVFADWPDELTAIVQQPDVDGEQGPAAAAQIFHGGNVLFESAEVGLVRMVRPDLLPHALEELRGIEQQLQQSTASQTEILDLLAQLISFVGLAASNGHCIVFRAGV